MYCWSGGAAPTASSGMADSGRVTKINHFYNGSGSCDLVIVQVLVPDVARHFVGDIADLTPQAALLVAKPADFLFQFPDPCLGTFALSQPCHVFIIGAVALVLVGEDGLAGGGVVP